MVRFMDQDASRRNVFEDGETKKRPLSDNIWVL